MRWAWWLEVSAVEIGVETNVELGIETDVELGIETGVWWC